MLTNNQTVYSPAATTASSQSINNGSPMDVNNSPTTSNMDSAIDMNTSPYNHMNGNVVGKFKNCGFKKCYF